LIFEGNSCSLVKLVLGSLGSDEDSVVQFGVQTYSIQFGSGNPEYRNGIP